MFHLVKYRYWFLIFSLIIIIPGTISWITKGLNVGIDFQGGADVRIRPQQELNITDVRNRVSTLKLEDLQVYPGTNANLPANQTVWVPFNTTLDSTVQQNVVDKLKGVDSAVEVNWTTLTGSNKKSFSLATVTKFSKPVDVSKIEGALQGLPKTTAQAGTNSTAAATPASTATPGATPAPKATATPTTSNSSGTIPVEVTKGSVKQGTTTQVITIRTKSSLNTQQLPTLMNALLQNNGSYVQVLSTSTVGPSVAGDTTRNAVFAVMAASLLILVYIWISFRKLPNAWVYGTCAILAMLHDVLVVLGIFSILGWALGVQIDALFITGLLTVIGFSVHDTIVVFDRVRENLQRRTSETFEQVVDASLIQTMARSLNTSLTVLFTLLALTLFSIEGSVRNFTLTLLIGIISGTYSSIFNASMLLVIWEKGELGLNRLKGGSGQITPKRELARSRG